MKLVRYGAPGREKPGILDAQGRIRDLSKIVPDIAGEVLSPKGLAKLRKLKAEKLPLVKGKPRLGSCVGKIGNLIGIGLNYSDHAAEAGMPVPKEPIFFNKAPTSICGPNDDTMIPKDSSKLDYEVELGVVIGSRARYLAKDKAMEVVAGYCLPTMSPNVISRSKEAAANGARAKAAKRLVRSGLGWSPRTKFAIRSGSTCGLRSTAKPDRKERPPQWCSAWRISSGTARSFS
jgi:hypothetical protein